MSIKLSDLKLLHDKGLALIYLRPKSKRPFETNWTKVSKKSWKELENSFEASYNVGVRLGEPSKLKSGKYLAAIDCDVKSKSRKALNEMNDALRKLGIDLKTAPIVVSGRGNGSRHVYVQTDTPMKPMKYAQSDIQVGVLMPGESDKPHSKMEIEKLSPRERADGYRLRAAWEISFMGTGQQTVLPPSTHPDSGMKYAWASPMTVKFTPIFDPGKFTAVKRKVSEACETAGLDFKAVEVDLYASKLSIPMIQMIEDGAGCHDRSASLMTVTMGMCRLGFTDNQILSVLSDENHWIAGAAYDHTQSRDRGRAVKWLHKYTLLKARYETSVMRYFDNPPKKQVPLSVGEVATLEAELDEEKNKTLPDYKGKKPNTTLRNTVHVLEHFMEGGLVGFNEFSGRPYFLKDTPYGGVKGKELADHDDLALVHHIACHYGFEPSQDLCFKAHSFIARKNKFHPVKDYLSRLVWDKKPRLDTWLKNAFKASGPNEYMRAVSRKVLVAAVTRVFEPGCKFDYVTVLEGNQGEGKSMTLGALASQPWFTDSLGDIHNKDVVDQMAGKWIIELSELASIRGRENEHVKSFLTRQVDRVRMSYGRRSEDYPRQSIFIGSTNSSEYFTDETGNRRYWPVKVEQANRVWLAENRDQLWAEAVMRYELGEDIYLSKELEAVAKVEQEKRFEVDEWEMEIKNIVSKNEGGESEGVFRTTELWRAINTTNMSGHPSDYDGKRVGRIMKRLGYETAVRRFGGVSGKCWVSKK